MSLFFFLSSRRLEIFRDPPGGGGAGREGPGGFGGFIGVLGALDGSGDEGDASITRGTGAEKEVGNAPLGVLPLRAEIVVPPFAGGVHDLI